MEFRNLIENYVPKCEQEQVDKMQILSYMDMFPDVLTRENKICHFTASALVVSKDLKKVLMEYHNIYDSWCWEGGHADGDSDFLAVAVREVEEETGLKIKGYENSKIESIDILPVLGHFKKGKWVSAHLHISVAYIFFAEEENVRNKPDENSAVEWKDIDEVVNLTSENYMIPVYEKLINKVKEMKK